MKTLRLSALLISIFACTEALSTPEPAHALWCCDFGGYTTSQYFGAGASCSEAAGNFRSLAKPEADAFCGGATLVCNATIPPCTYNPSQPGGPWVIDGVMTFDCKYWC